MKGGPVYHTVLALLIGVVTLSGGHSYMAPPISLVKVSVFYETLCEDTINFFRNELVPVHQNLGSIMDLEFIPFGKAISRPYLNLSSSTGVSFYNECQHGANECLGNRLMSCAKSILDITTQTKFFFCAMSKLNPQYKYTDPNQMLQVFSMCATQFSINWNILTTCTNSHLGKLYFHLNGVKTLELNPKIDFVPTILIEGIIPAIQYMPKEDCKTTLKEQVCLANGNISPACNPAMLPQPIIN